MLLVELEIAYGERPFSFPNTYQAVRGSVEELNRAATLTELYDTAARAVRDLTGFDRVMVYRYDEDYNGEVVAESKRDGPQLVPRPALPVHRHPGAGAGAVREELDPAHLGRRLHARAAGAGRRPGERHAAGPHARDAAQRLAHPRRVPAEHGCARIDVDLVAAATGGCGGSSPATTTPVRICRRSAPGRRPSSSARPCRCGSSTGSRTTNCTSGWPRRRCWPSSPPPTLDDSEPLAAALLGAPDLLDLVPADGVVVHIAGRARGARVGSAAGGRVRRRRLGARVRATRSRAASACPASYPRLDLDPQLAAGALALNLPDGQYADLVPPRGAALGGLGWRPATTRRSRSARATGVRLSPRKSFERWREIVRERSEPWTPERDRVRRGVATPPGRVAVPPHAGRAAGRRDAAAQPAARLDSRHWRTGSCRRTTSPPRAVDSAATGTTRSSCATAG